ncbi:MAG: peroxide stress protein YaaA [Firmicutes bacterium HGW-Firmicutes-5]|nr:MAG: peroxide stress protein YaaA [Firmicutes bacterium HGW-Firmicutes-5]
MEANMKIIISPSKTQNYSRIHKSAVHEPLFNKEALYLNQRLKKLSKKSLSHLMGIDNTLLEQTYSNIKDFDIATPNCAISTYTGLVYKQLSLDTYNNEQIEYLEKHLVILSAMYGALKPFDGIKPYRLDMKMPLIRPSLYKYWEKPLAHYFKNETVLIDLSSNEYGKMLPSHKITVKFMEKKDPEYKNIATYSKIARGQLLDLMIKNQITQPHQLKTVSFEGYHYNANLSNERSIVFTRP